MDSHFLAFDLGAESGRAILGKLRSGMLDISEVYRFPNDPVLSAQSLRWDILRLWLEMKKSLDALPVKKLDSIGVDTWGVELPSSESAAIVENPYDYRDRRTDGIMEEVFQHVTRETIYSFTGIQFMPLNTLYQFYAQRAVQHPDDRCRSGPADYPGPFKLLAERPDGF